MTGRKYRVAGFVMNILLFLVNRKKGLRAHLATLGEHTVAFQLKRLEQPLLVRISHGLLKRTDEPVEPEVIFKGTALVLSKIALGIIDPDSAFFERKITIEGSTPFSLLMKNALDRFSR